ncbi:LysR family transcriptional regulator [Clostridium carboxidivorans P7]|uniref:Transcriptional regulator, LysR family n=1 Tax=Clostridium carboxidivorans P7 TaxID=536227 RepID=C6PV58_9CLOT|nr:LysR family transcriptional regulator [Clostridium carboxidivorans]AKN33793.1 LysR family transcriptional regulator [Clostridium carboxidivorans P7]EET86876.1 transcriptional regulator, LysR family [Clostridium carboxidivorans P7]EFG86597.1 LysR substrate binding domain protein [Clostridium carboxidivorans P7]
MNTHQLECFILLAKSLNFTKASKAMYITQPAYSRIISNLEEDIGAKLFIRDKRSVKLTAAGKTFLEEAEKMIYHYNNSLIKVRQSEEGYLGSLKIGFLEASLHDFLPDFVNFFRKKYPNISLVMADNRHTALLNELYNDKVDIAFTNTAGFIETNDLVFKTIYEDYYCAVLPVDHPKAKDDTIELLNLRDDHFILMNPNVSAQSNNRIKNICLSHGFIPKVSGNANTVTALLTLVSCGMGVSVLLHSLEYLAQNNIKFLRIKRNNDPIRVVAAYKKVNDNPCIPIFTKALDEYNSVKNL